MNKIIRKRFGLIGLLLLIGVALVAVLKPSVHPAATLPLDTGNVAWLLTASGLVLLMTPGLSFFYGGMVNSKNIISTMLQSMIAMGVITILWFVVGFSLAFGDSLGGFIGNPFTFFMFNNVGTAPHPRLGSAIPLVLYAAFQLKFAIITPGLITGSFAERVKFWSYLIFISLFSLLIYAPLAHWTWHPDGFLYKWGVLDFAGGTVVHISAGFAALAGAMVLGRRKTHQNNETHQVANLPYVIIGTALLWFGWFGFNAGSSLEANALAVDAFINTHLAAASGMFGWILFDSSRGKKPSAMGACIGAVVGLVAITPAAGYVAYGPALFIGLAASIVSNVAVSLKTRTVLDDTLDVFPCHGLGGIVGMIFTAVFAQKGGLITGSSVLFVQHIKALVVVSVFTFGGSWVLYVVVNHFFPMRVTPEEELIGLDISQHGESIA